MLMLLSELTLFIFSSFDSGARFFVVVSSFVFAAGLFVVLFGGLMAGLEGFIGLGLVGFLVAKYDAL